MPLARNRTCSCRGMLAGTLSSRSHGTMVELSAPAVIGGVWQEAPETLAGNRGRGGFLPLPTTGHTPCRRISRSCLPYVCMYSVCIVQGARPCSSPSAIAPIERSNSMIRVGGWATLPTIEGAGPRRRSRTMIFGC